MTFSLVFLSFPVLAGTPVPTPAANSISVTVSTVDELVAAAAAVTNGGAKEIVLKPGTYALKETLTIGVAAAVKAGVLLVPCAPTLDGLRDGQRTLVRPQGSLPDKTEPHPQAPGGRESG